LIPLEFETVKNLVSSPVKFTAPPILGEMLVIVGAASGTLKKVATKSAVRRANFLFPTNSRVNICIQISDIKVVFSLPCQMVSVSTLKRWSNGAS
jgi:hypothetical protein